MFADEQYVKTTEQRRGQEEYGPIWLGVYNEFIFHTIFVKMKKLQVCFVIYSSRYEII